MYIASNDIKKYMPHPGWKIYVFQNTLMTSHECGASLIQILWGKSKKDVERFKFYFITCGSVVDITSVHFRNSDSEVWHEDIQV